MSLDNVGTVLAWKFFSVVCTGRGVHRVHRTVHNNSPLIAQSSYINRESTAGVEGGKTGASTTCLRFPI
jgi:hypothetical protein